jgi:hypothetical protein
MGRFLRIENADPTDGVGAATERGSSVELFCDPWHGNQCDVCGDDVELHLAQPGQILQIGIAHKLDRHQPQQRRLAIQAQKIDANHFFNLLTGPQ